MANTKEYTKKQTSICTILKLKQIIKNLNKLPKSNPVVSVILKATLENLKEKATEQDFISFCETLN